MMKLKIYIFGAVMGALSLTCASCYNADREFPDYEKGTTAYFAYQNPVRTLVLGNDIYDNTLDNAHKCRIWSTMGGAYSGRNAIVEKISLRSERGNPETNLRASGRSPIPKPRYSG